MFNLLDDVVSRVEQSRLAYNSQTEEFRDLNGNFQVYLNDIKKIDDENRQLQDNIEQIRMNYIQTLENHLKRLPQDFRDESHRLTEAHIERYKSKSHARRFINEREELKKRINFVASNEKDQIKRINNLQKQQNIVQKELKTLNEQVQNLYSYVENEKQLHRQATNKVDELQIQLEQICIQRSKTEFEIQTLREELKLMQTAKEFLDDEHQIILSTQTEANEYLLSCLSESISRIREDFNELNKTQIKQMDNEYKQMMITAEENSLANANNNETMANQQHTIQIECEKLQNEQRSMTKELTLMNDHNIVLAERILAMEADLYSIRDEHVKELMNKDNELERSKIQLQSLNEKLNHLAEYDRNLKFELTLYRGVLEGEYRRKQQQQQLINNQNPQRPTTLRTTLVRSNKNSPILNNQNEVDITLEKTNAELDQILSVMDNLDDENNVENTNQTENQEQTIPDLTATQDSPKTPSSHTYSESQHTPMDAWQSPSSALGVQVYLITASKHDTPSIANTCPILTEVYRKPPTNSELLEQPSEMSSTDQEISSDMQTSVYDQQEDSNTTQLEDYQLNPTMLKEVEALSKISLLSQQIFSETHRSSSTTSENEQIASDIEEPIVNEIPMKSSPVNLSDIEEPQPAPATLISDECEILPSVSTNLKEIVDDEYAVTEPSQGDDENTNLSLNESNEVIESSTIKENDINQLEEINENIDSNENKESTIEHDEIHTEEQQSFSDQYKTEEDKNFDFISSPGYYGTINDGTNFNRDELNTQTLLDDVENDQNDFNKEADTSSLKSEGRKIQDYDESHLEAVMQDLRSVYCDLVNSEDLLEITDDFPDNLIDRLEFGDNLIRILFDGLLRRYLVQTSKAKVRPKTLDWIEFRDILFPILTGRFMELHIRKLFNLFDIKQYGCLTLEQITELLELLQVNNTSEFTDNMLRKFNKTEDEKINADELVEAMKEFHDAKINLLSDDIEYKPWYSRSIIDEDNLDSKAISFEVPNVITPAKVDEEILGMINSGMILLGRIFKRVGPDIETKKLDSNKQTLSMQITNEFIHNNIHISSDDLQSFIELYLNRKRNSDIFISWIEFRDLCLPFVIGGMFLKENIENWFHIFDESEQRIIMPDQVLHLLRLLQIANPDNIIKMMIDISDTYTNTIDNSWTLEELIFALDNIDEVTVRMLSSNELILPYDFNWYAKI